MEPDLKSLYEGFFRNFRVSEELSERCSPPLLLSPKENWAQQHFKLLIIGQETLDWNFAPGRYYDWPTPPISTLTDFFATPDRVDALMLGYRIFNFAKCEPGNRNSPFWRAFRQISEQLGCEALWTNLFRCSVDGGSVLGNATLLEQAELLKAQKGLLADEIKLLKPDCVIFFTGPNYDDALLSEFPDAKLLEVEGWQKRRFVGIESRQLPVKTFRTYHPSYLNRNQDRWAWLDVFIQMLQVE